MKKIRIALLLTTILSLTGLTSCSKQYDVTLTIFNWEDYIYDGTDDDGNKVTDSVIEAFEKDYFKKTGKTMHVNYQTFSVCEDLYALLSDKGAIKVDLCCPSDYMIQKMQSENMLESFNYNYETSLYEEGLDNVNEYLSPYIRDLFDINQFSDFAVPYFWGTMGYTYNPELIDEEAISSWEFQWNPGNDLNGNPLKKRITVKKSVRDTYFTAVMHVYRDELMALKEQYESDEIERKDYTAKLSEIFNRCDKKTLELVGVALKELKANVQLEVDSGKSDIVTGQLAANLAWSGDSVYSMDTAEESNVYLNYIIPEEGSNVWFDGWCMPKGANIEASKAFLDFIAKPDVIVSNMYHTGYTSPFAGQAVLDYVNETYSLDSYENEDGSNDYQEEDCDKVDLSYFFGDTIDEGEEAIILVPKEERGRQFDAQYPTEETIARCAIMKDFGEDGNKALFIMWNNFKIAL